MSMRWAAPKRVEDIGMTYFHKCTPYQALPILQDTKCLQKQSSDFPKRNTTANDISAITLLLVQYEPLCLVSQERHCRGCSPAVENLNVPCENSTVNSQTRSRRYHFSSQHERSRNTTKPTLRGYLRVSWETFRHAVLFAQRILEDD